MKTYRIIIKGKPSVRITEVGAKIIWKAYTTFCGNSPTQTMEQREARGGIAHDSEIEYWKKKGYLPADFDFKDYLAK